MTDERMGATIQTLPAGFRFNWMTDGPIHLHTSGPPLGVPIFERADQSNCWFPGLPGLTQLADEMDAAAKRAEHRDPSSRRHRLRPARVTP